MAKTCTTNTYVQETRHRLYSDMSRGGAGRDADLCRGQALHPRAQGRQCYVPTEKKNIFIERPGKKKITLY